MKRFWNLYLLALRAFFLKMLSDSRGSRPSGVVKIGPLGTPWCQHTNMAEYTARDIEATKNLGGSQ